MPHTIRQQRMRKLEDAFEDLGAIDETPLASLPVQLPSATRQSCRDTDAAIAHLDGRDGSTESLQGQQPVNPLGDESRSSDSGSSGGSTSGNYSQVGHNGSGPASGSVSGSAESVPTEMIFKLERRGNGWGEEIFPHITVENRPLEKPSRNRPRSTQPDPWQVTFLNHRLCVQLCLQHCLDTMLYP